MPSSSEQLADIVRELSPGVAVDVTDAFLQRHPDWRTRYGARARSAGVQDAGYHLAFLAGAAEIGDPSAFAAYARWAGHVLAARGITRPCLAENLEQLREALALRLAPAQADALAGYFDAAVDALRIDSEDATRPTLSQTADVFLQAILTGQRHAAVQIAREAVRSGLTLQELYIDVFQPALYEVGARWEANRLTVAQEHIATAVTQYVMAQIYEPPPIAGTAGSSVVITGVEGELHSVGAVMVADLLESYGWRVRFLGTNLPIPSILGVIRDMAPSHVGISATMLFNAGAVRHLIQAIRSEFGTRITVVVGGAAFRAAPELWRQVAADAFAADLRGVHSLLGGTS